MKYPILIASVLSSGLLPGLVAAQSPAVTPEPTPAATNPSAALPAVTIVGERASPGRPT